MKREKYTVKGTLTFALGSDGLMYRIHEFKEDWEKFFATKSISDLMTGMEFLQAVEDGLFIDYDGSIANIFVDGYDSNLGLVHEGICQGGFLVDKDVFIEICEDHTVEVNWANK